MRYPKLVILSCLAALACNEKETESPHYQRYGAEAGGGVEAPIEADTYTWDWEWEEADLDRDQRVVREEWDRNQVLRLDTDADGIVTREEIEGVFGDGEMYQRLGPVGPQGFTLEEARAGLFDALDANNSGAIEPSEWPGAGSR